MDAVDLPLLRLLEGFEGAPRHWTTIDHSYLAYCILWPRGLSCGLSSSFYFSSNLVLSLILVVCMCFS